MNNDDLIPLQDVFQLEGPDGSGIYKAVFFAFNTVITLLAGGQPDLVARAFSQVRDECRRFERLFSRTLPHSDISRLNQAAGAESEVSADTYKLLQAAQHYCRESRGTFDITVGPLVALWDFNEQRIPDEQRLRDAARHVGWQGLTLRADGPGSPTSAQHCYYARLADPLAALDAGGIAKGYIADSLTDSMLANQLQSFCISLGGNTVARGRKPNGQPWQVGIQDPADKTAIIGALELIDASLVTSGIYERSFTLDGCLYHHILDPQAGHPVDTDVAGVSVLAKRSIDAEGFSTTLLALGLNEGIAFARSRPEIESAIFVDKQGGVFST